MVIGIDKLKNYESRCRAKLINSMVGIKQAFLTGTRSNYGRTNLATFNSLIHIGADPTLRGFLCQSSNFRRATFRNILETNGYTFNYINSSCVGLVHQTSAKYIRDVSNFSACGFTEIYRKNFYAPFVAEAHIKIAFQFEQKVNIPTYETLIIIGSIQYIDINEDLISPDGIITSEIAGTLVCAGLDAYYENRLIERLS